MHTAHSSVFGRRSHCDTVARLATIQQNIVAQWLSTGGYFALQKTFSNAWRCYNYWCGGCYWHLVDQGQGCAKHPTMHRTSPALGKELSALESDCCRLYSEVSISSRIVLLVSQKPSCNTNFNFLWEGWWYNEYSPYHSVHFWNTL